MKYQKRDSVKAPPPLLRGRIGRQTTKCKQRECTVIRLTAVVPLVTCIRRYCSIFVTHVRAAVFRMAEAVAGVPLQYGSDRRATSGEFRRLFVSDLANGSASFRGNIVVA